MSKLLMLSAAPLALLAFSGGALAQTPQSSRPLPEQNAGAPTPTSPVGAQSSTTTSQTAAPSSNPPGAQPGGPATLGEVVVTAQRRTENLQKAAIAVDVVGGADLVQNNITQPTDLGFLVPALTPTPGGFFLRGVGNFTTTPYADPAIAFNYDGVYIGRISDTNGYFYDLQRVEVLKDPQGTLYGRNATGGAINVIPETPKLGSYSGYINMAGGNYGTYDIEGAVNLPLGQDTAIRLSTDIVGHNGYLSDGTQDEDEKAGRIQILHRFSPDLTVRLAADFEELGGAGLGANYVGKYVYSPAAGRYTFVSAGLPRADGLYDPASQAFHNSALAGPAGTHLVSIPNYPYQNEKFYGVNAEINYDTPIGHLVVEPEYRQSKPNTRTVPLTFTADDKETDEQYSVEARFLGKRIGPLDYTVGGLYYHENDVEQFSINQQALAIYSGPSYQLTRSWAVFARATVHLSDRLRLTGGIRYTDDYKTTNSVSTSLTIICLAQARGTGLCPTAPLFTLVPTLAQQPIPFPAIAGVPTILPGTGAIVSRSNTVVNLAVNNSRPTYRGAIEFDLAPQSLAYASVESGFRSGGFGLSAGYFTFQPEYITAYTAGIKNRFLENRLQLNLEAFYWQYKNQQLQHLGVDLNGAQGLFTQNIGGSVEKGAEAEARFLATPTTVMSADLQYEDATYGSFIFNQPSSVGPVITGCAQTAISATVRQVNCTGMPVYNTPKWTLNLGIEQTFHLDRFNLVASADTQYKTSRYVGFEYLPTELAPPVWQTNAQLTLTPTTGPWSLQLFVHNIENVRYDVNANLGSIGNLLATITSSPRTFGGRVTLKF